jgi:hypothetical protein
VLIPGETTGSRKLWYRNDPQAGTEVCSVGQWVSMRWRGEKRTISPFLLCTSCWACGSTYGAFIAGETDVADG